MSPREKPYSRGTTLKSVITPRNISNFCGAILRIQKSATTYSHRLSRARLRTLIAGFAHGAFAVFDGVLRTLVDACHAMCAAA